MRFSLSNEGWKTVRTAIRGWGPTMRLVTLMTAAAVLPLVASMVALHIAR